MLTFWYRFAFYDESEPSCSMWYVVRSGVANEGGGVTVATPTLLNFADISFKKFKKSKIFTNKFH